MLKFVNMIKLALTYKWYNYMTITEQGNITWTQRMLDTSARSDIFYFMAMRAGNDKQPVKPKQQQLRSHHLYTTTSVTSVWKKLQISSCTQRTHPTHECTHTHTHTERKNVHEL